MRDEVGAVLPAALDVQFLDHVAVVLEPDAGRSIVIEYVYLRPNDREKPQTRAVPNTEVPGTVYKRTGRRLDRYNPPLRTYRSHFERIERSQDRRVETTEILLLKLRPADIRTVQRRILAHCLGALLGAQRARVVDGEELGKPDGSWTA